MNELSIFFVKLLIYFLTFSFPSYGLSNSVGFEVVAGPLFTSITKLELMSSQKELLTSSKFLGADMETSILRKSGRPVNMVRAFADRCEEGQSTREELKKKKMIDREEAIKKLSKIISRLEK